MHLTKFGLKLYGLNLKYRLKIKSLISWQYTMSKAQKRKICDLPHKSNIFVYRGEGSNGEGRKFFYDALVETVDSRYHNIEYISPEEIKEGSWTQTCCLIAFGGGYDLGFIKALGDKGTQTIRKFVEQGGSYLGFCAGAYWACNYIEFDKGGPLEVIGERFLKFYPGNCIGPTFPGFGYKNKEGVRATPVSYKGLVFNAYLHGGGFFTRPEVLLKTDVSNSDSDQQNMYIVTPESSEIKDFPCAKKLTVTNMTAGREEQDLQNGTTPQETQWIMPNTLIDVCDTPSKSCDKKNEKSAINPRSYEILGTFTTLSDTPAVFVKCKVGRGKAILSGAHIEYPVAFLDGKHPNVKPVMPELNQGEEARDFVFRDILSQFDLKLKQTRSLL